MDNKDDGSIQPQVIDLHAAKRGDLDESWLRMFGGAVKGIMNRMFGGPEFPVSIRGTESEVKSFASALDRERHYANAYKRYGLDDPRTYQNRYKLESAVKEFETITKLRWPFK